MGWIKCSTHPDDLKVLRLAQITKTDPDRVYRCVLRWFFWLDANYQGKPLTVTESALHDLTRWTSREPLATAMTDVDVDWLRKTADDTYEPTRLDSHFSASAKTRALTKARVQAHRERKASGNDCNALRNALPLISVSDSGSESAQSNPEERRNTQTARPHAREEKADEKFTAAADALAEWGWRQPYDACLSGIKTQIGRAIDAIQGAGADIGLIPRAVAHHKSQAKPFKSVDYARSIVLSAINERAWEAVVPVQRQETAKERVDRIMAARAAKNGAKA